MSASEIAAAEAQMGFKFPVGTTTGGGGTGTGTGTGTGGTGTSGNIRDTIFQSMALAGGVSPYLQDFLKIPTIGQRDAVNGAIGTAADPLFMQYSGSCNDAITGAPVPGGPGSGGGTGPGSGGGFNFAQFWVQLMQKLLGGIGNMFKFNVNNIVDGTAFWKITNNQLLSNMRRY
ncbi:MAG TPA: hypothetical protein VL854_11530 [Nitrososphaeraceae archaeon]|nr:hypothetical protein [Nitrososphaeraceae archaeon]